jgi:hypothetical protein
MTARLPNDIFTVPILVSAGFLAHVIPSDHSRQGTNISSYLVAWV